jgi:hypothetical protein
MSSKLGELSEKLNDIFKEQRAGYSKFFFQIALFSAGTISLSITFLNFLIANKIEFKTHQALLIIAWSCLSISLITSLLRNYIYNHFGHYQVISEYNEEVYKSTGKNRHKQDLDNTRQKEEFFKKLWEMTEYTSLILFPLGILLIMIFAGVTLLK